MPAPDFQVRAGVGIGSNLDDPVARVRAGMAALAQLPHTRLIVCSSLYRSAPVGLADQPDFINGVCMLETGLDARTLMTAMLGIEATHHRVRTLPGGPRTLDLDLLWYGDRICDEPGLTVPHPRLHERAFVLLPLAEIAPDMRVPGRGLVVELIATLPPQRIERLEIAA